MLEIGQTYTHRGKTATILKIDVTTNATYIYTDKGAYGEKVFREIYMGVKK